MRLDTSLIPGKLHLGFRGLGVLGSAIAATGTNGAGFGYASVQPADLAAELRFEIIEFPPGTLDAAEDTSFTYSGASGTFTFRKWRNGVLDGVGVVLLDTGTLPQVSGVTVAGGAATITGGAQRQLTATVAGVASPSQAVIWSTSAGTVSLTGVLAAPAATEFEQVFTVTAASVQDPTMTGSFTFMVPAASLEPEPEPEPDLPDERNYAWLQAEVLDWLHRPDLATKVPKFITMAEARVNRLLQARGMEIESTLTFTPGVGALRLPAGFNTPIAAWLVDGAGRQDLTCVAPELMPASTQRGAPSYWAISGAYLALNCPADVARKVTLRYRGLLRLTDELPNNSVLSKYPDVYLYGSLMEAALWLRDPEQLGTWSPLFDTAMKELNRNEGRARSLAPLRTELAALLG